MSALRVRFSLSALRGAFRWLLLFCRYFSDRGVSCPTCARFAPFFSFRVMIAAKWKNGKRRARKKEEVFVAVGASAYGRAREGRLPARGSGGEGPPDRKIFLRNIQ